MSNALEEPRKGRELDTGNDSDDHSTGNRYQNIVNHGSGTLTLGNIHYNNTFIQSESLTADVYHRLARWLKVPDPSTNYLAALAKRHGQTGSWLLTSPQLRAWKYSTPSLIWLHGKAGCGKTVLSAVALQHILEDMQSQPDVVVIYFYFDFSDEQKQKTISAWRSLLLQLAIKVPACLTALEQAHQQCDNGSRQLSDHMVRSMLMDGLAESSPAYLILDALDECTDRSNLLAFLRSLVVASDSSVRVLATSRQERDIEEELEEIADQSINIQSVEVDHDIGLYVQDQLSNDRTLQRWSSTVKKEILDALIGSADGMFRWAFCQLEDLRSCLKLSALRRALASLPKSLDETYVRIINSVRSNEHHAEDVTTVLRWLCFAKRPLRLQEVAEILAIKHGADGGFDPDEQLLDPYAVKTICSSLISCRRVGQGGQEEGDGEEDKRDSNTTQRQDQVEVQLAHFSVKEYLLSERSCLRTQLASELCHDIIVESCLHYILYDKDAMSAADIELERPLIPYAAEYWWQHAQNVSGKLSLTTVSLINALFTSRMTLLVWLRHYNVDRPWQSRSGHQLNTDDVALPLYYASLCGIIEATSHLLDRGAEVSAAEGYYGDALQAASWKGHLQVVQLLLDRGADVNAGGRYDNALQAASKRGHFLVVQLLQKYGAVAEDGR